MFLLIQFLHLLLNWPQDVITDHHFREWWRQAVPKVLSPSPKMDYLNPTAHFDEEQIKCELFEPMEKFLCAIDRSKAPAEIGSSDIQSENPSPPSLPTAEQVQIIIHVFFVSNFEKSWAYFIVTYFNNLWLHIPIN